MRREGDISRHRRLIGTDAKLTWYAYYRTVRFAESDFKCHHHGQKDDPMNAAEANQLLEVFNNQKTNLEKFSIPFPMGVFGTLREGKGNNHRMYNGKPCLHKRAFLPHFVAHGLSISFRKDSTAAFEVFFYAPNEWKKMIPGVDSLESFSPSQFKEDFKCEWAWGYHRTLAWLHLLPDDYDHPIYHKELGGHRDLQIPVDQWNNFEKIPCWVYSSLNQNEIAKSESECIIWG